MSRANAVRAGLLLTTVLTAVGLALILGTPDAELMRSRVARAGVWGPLAFFGLYTALALLPVPKALLTVAGGALFGLWWGAGLSLGAALAGAIICFGWGRLLGREIVDRLARGRLGELDSLLTSHGLAAVLVVRLVPFVPFTAINYASGLTGVRFGPYVLGSALGMIPGSLAYAALGAYGTDPWGLAVTASALVVILVAGSWGARRLQRRHRGEVPLQRPLD